MGVLALVGGACSDDDDGPGSESGDPAVFVTAAESSCSAGTDGFVREAGSQINIDFINERADEVVFEVQLDDPEAPVLHSETVPAGETVRANVEVAEPGRYALSCGSDQFAGLRFEVLD